MAPGMAGGLWGSICQIGIAKFADGELAGEWSTFVDPEDYFDDVNIAIHGIERIGIIRETDFRTLTENHVSSTRVRSPLDFVWPVRKSNPTSTPSNHPARPLLRLQSRKPQRNNQDPHRTNDNNPACTDACRRRTSQCQPG